MIEELDIPKAHDSIEGVPEPSASDYLTGHDQIADFLAQAYREGRMHHALLLRALRDWQGNARLSSRRSYAFPWRQQRGAATYIRPGFCEAALATDRRRNASRCIAYQSTVRSEER